MFHSARIKLTAWYLFIIMVICFLFSGSMYNILNNELERISRRQRMFIQREFNGVPPPVPEFLAPDGRTIELIPIEETRQRLQFTLLAINAIILSISGLAGYFLAGRTLSPIQEMLEEQNRFISDASHELRTPLTSLRSEIEVNLRDVHLSLAEAKDLLRSNLEDVRSLQLLSDNLLRLTQFQQHKQLFSIEEVSLREIISECLKKVQALAKEKHIVIDQEVPPLKIEADRQHLVELCIIFLDNAIKYSPEHSHIIIEVKKIDGYVELKIADKGIGISEDDIPHIFDRFYRADSSRQKKDTPGYGLGLSIAKQIVDKHFGTITVQSTQGKETIFTIRLPIKHTQ